MSDGSNRSPGDFASFEVKPPDVHASVIISARKRRFEMAWGCDFAAPWQSQPRVSQGRVVGGVLAWQQDVRIKHHVLTGVRT
jgi:hypothetical protein